MIDFNENLQRINEAISKLSDDLASLDVESKKRGLSGNHPCDVLHTHRVLALADKLPVVVGPWESEDTHTSIRYIPGTKIVVAKVWDTVETTYAQVEGVDLRNRLCRVAIPNVKVGMRLADEHMQFLGYYLK